MPGNCSVAPNSEAFTAIDQGSGTPELYDQALSACRVCPQLDYCAGQRSEIAVEIIKEGAAAEQTVIGGEVGETGKARATYRSLTQFERLRDPTIRFDIKKTPRGYSSRQKLNAIRQALRAGQIRLSGGQPSEQRQLFLDHLQETPAAAALRDKEREEALTRGTQLLWRFRNFGIDRPSRVPITKEDLAVGAAIFAEYTADVIALRGFSGALCFSQYHEPRLVGRLLSYVTKETGLTAGRAKDTIRLFPTDPITALQKAINARRTTQQAIGAVVPPELQRYKASFSRLNNAVEIRGKYSTLEKNLAKLAEQDDIAPTARAYIAHHYADNLEGAAAEYRQAHAALLQQYGTHPYFTPAIMRRLAAGNLNGAERAARTHIEQVEALKESARGFGLELPDAFARRTAAEGKIMPQGETLLRRYLVYEVKGRYDAVTDDVTIIQALLADGNAARFVAAYPERKTRTEALRAACNLAVRGLLEVRDGQYQWTAEAEYLTDDERRIVAITSDLYKIIDPSLSVSDYTAEAMANARQLVNTVLVPHLFHNAPNDLLDQIRYTLHCHPKTRTGGLHSSESAALYSDLLSRMPDISAEGKAVLASFTKLGVRMFPGQKTHRPSRPIALEEYAKAAESLLASATVIGRAALLYDAKEFEQQMDHAPTLPKASGSIYARAAGNSHPFRFLRRCERHAAYVATRECGQRIPKRIMVDLLAKKDLASIVTTLDAIEDAEQRYDRNHWIGMHMVYRICLIAPSRDPFAEINRLIAIAKKLAVKYENTMGQGYVVNLCSRNREDPEGHVAKVAAKMQELAANYAHPESLNQHVLFVAASGSADTKAWLAAYEERYAYARTFVGQGYDLETIKRLAANNVKPSALDKALTAYMGIHQRFAYDDYLEPWMIDDVIRWDIKSAARKIKNLRFLLSRGLAVRYEKQDLFGRPLHETTMALTAPGADMALIEKETNIEHQRQIAAHLAGLDTNERAAVLFVYGLPWLIEASDTDNADPQVLYSHFKVNNFDELNTLVTQKIIPKIKAG